MNNPKSQFESTTRTLRLTALALTAGLICSTSAVADEFRWTGTGSDNSWNTIGNWERFDGVNWVAAASAPGSLDTVRLDDTAANTAQTIDIGTSMVTIESLLMEATGNRDYTLTGTTGELELASTSVEMSIGAASTTDLTFDVQTRNVDGLTRFNNSSGASRMIFEQTFTVGGSIIQQGTGMIEVRTPIVADSSAAGNARWTNSGGEILFNYSGSGVIFNRNVRWNNSNASNPTNLFFAEDTEFGGIWAWPQTVSGSVNLQLLEAGSNDVVVSANSITNLSTTGTSTLNLIGPADSSSGSLTLELNGVIGPTNTDRHSVAVVIGDGNFMSLGSSGSISAPSAADLTGGLSGLGGLIKDSTGTSDIGEINTYTGGTFIEQGTLRIIETSIPTTLDDPTPVDYAGTLGTGLLHIANGATFDMNDLDQTVAGLRDSEVTLDGGEVDLGATTAGTLILDVASDSSFGGDITGSGDVSKEGNALQTLSGTVGFTGNLNVTSGTLSADGTIADTVALSVDAGGTLAGTGAIAADTTIGGALAPGNSPGTLSFSGDVTFDANSTVNFEFGALDDDLIVLNGSNQVLTANGLVLWSFDGAGNISTGVDYQLMDWSGATGLDNTNFALANMGIDNTYWSGTFSNGLGNDGLYVNFSTIPEPNTAALLAGSLVLAAGFLNRRRNRR